MKRILTFIIALVISVLGLNAQNFDVIDSELQMMLSQKSNEPISINIILDSQFDADRLNNFDNKSEKREYVISELKKFSSENQNKVMAYLQAEEGNNVTNLKSHWLVNTISCTATRDVIYKTSELSGISLIAHNGKEKLIGDYKPMKAQKQRGLIQNVTTVGADQVWAEGYTGKDVIVAVLDSGVNSEHVDLKDHLWDGGSEYPDHGWNFIDNNSNTNDYNGHGTHCAGTICGDGTSGTQTGMAPDATLMCVKVLDDDGRGTLEALVSGIEFAVENGADILSISLGWTYPNSYVSGIMREMFENVMYAGVVASVAAGNERDGIDTIPIPYNINAPGNCPPPWLHPDQQANAGGLSAVVSVGAVDYSDEPAYFSSEGPVTWQGSQWHDYLLNSGVEIDENWLHYDNGIFETSIGGLESFYWGVMFPAATLQQHSGDMLSKISVYDYCADTPELLVYYGGDYAPEMLVHTQTFELTGSNSVVEIDLTSSLPIDRNENLWIVLFSNNGTDFPAAACSDTGNPNGRWLSMDGTTWGDLSEQGLEYTWMIRAFVSNESGSAVAELKSIDDYEYKSSKGKLSALKADSKRSGAASNDSNFGLIRPDVSAPGVDIVSAAYDDNYGFYSYSGTSMATPCVAGVMALMLDKNPDLTPADICRILETTATPLDYKKSNRTGSGRINAYDACEMIENEEGPSGKSFFTFESGLDGWTTIDADNDGYKWINSSDYFAADLGPQGFNGSNCAMSQSYINEVGVLYPDNYLVSPEKYLIDNSSKIKFMAAAQDPSWAAEHFGVAVSTASNNNANDFTTIAEWTMTSRAMGNQKSQAKGFETKATGTWFQYEVDLSQYAGQEVWLAIRHFNCSDQFILCVDNVEIINSSTPEQPTFGTDGTCRFAVSNYVDYLESVLVQEDGKIITVGRSRTDGYNWDIYASRHNADGTLDETYGEGGINFFEVKPNTYINGANDAVLSEDGLLYIAGWTFDYNDNTAFVLCLDENGYKFSGFGNNGIVETEYGGYVVYEAIDIDSEGNIVVVGNLNDLLLIRRYLPNGQLDTSFGNNGTVNDMLSGSELSYGYDVEILEDGRIVVVGNKLDDASNFVSKAYISRYNADGSLDATFGNNGVVDINVCELYEQALGVEVDALGNYLVTGHSELPLINPNSQIPSYESYIARITMDGVIDTSFGEDGDGFVRFEAFEGDGCANNQETSSVVAPDGQIFGTFYSYNHYDYSSCAYVYNLDENGKLKDSFADAGLLPITPSYGDNEIRTTSLALQNDGKLLVGGYIYHNGGSTSDIFISRISTDAEMPEQPNQSLLFSYEGNLIEPTTINITRELNSSMEIQFDLEVTNNTGNPVNVVCEIEDNSGIGSNYVCWGSCYAPGMYNVVNTLDAFSTSMFNGHCMFVDENWNELPKGTVIPMKYTFYDENNPSEKYTFNVNFKYDTPQQQYRNVLIEEFTGRNCPYCPMGHKALDDISNINPGKVFPVNIHAQNSLSPSSYPNLNIDVSSSYYNAFNNMGGIPSVMVNRVGESVHPANNECSNLVSQQLSQLAEVNIDGKVVINPDTRVAEITVELEYTSSSAYNTNYLTIMMLQDNIIGSQQGSSYNPEQIVDGQYRHMHVLRDVITPTWGDAVSPATAGTLITKQYIYNIPEIIGDPNGVEVDLDNIYFLAFVAETYQGTPTRPILNVNKLEQKEGVDEPVYAFIKDAVQENTSTCSYEKKFVLNIANAGTDNITSIEFEIDVEGGDITEYQWNGFIPSHENTDIDLFAYIPEGEHEVTFRIVAINGEYFYSEKTILAMSEKIVEVETSDANEQFTLELAQDRFGNQITWSVVGHNGNIIAEGGPYQMLSTVGTLLHVEYFTLPAGECAEFIINDNVGNGINGVFGQGYYKIYDSNYNVVVESDGKYENGESHIIYVNDDGETPYYWTPDPSLYANNMTVISTIAIDGVEQSDFNLELGAFCGDEVRGSSKLQYVGSPANRYECFLMVYGNAGDNITFKLYDHATETVSDLKTNQSVTFEVNGAVGDVINPYAINFTSTIVHNQELKSGWNWYSTYVVNEGAEGLANLENAVGTSGIQIKNQSKFVNQAGGNWYGTLTETSVEDMFMIQMSSATNVTLEGYEVNPAEHPITLGTNWKWISYPVSASISVEEAFASANPSNGDYVKSQTGFAQYYDGLGWSGTLKTMTPGLGYMYQNKSGYAKTLVYPSSSSSKGSVKSNVTTDNNHWTADYSKYPMNMTMIAVVEGAESAYEVAAFADGECRGSARPIYVEALDSYIMFMTISGEDGETLTFKYYDVNTGETYAIADEFTFSVNATVGDVMNPYVMTRGAMGIDELSSSINIYPNPVDNELFLATEVRVEEIAIYDVYGRKTTVYGLQTTDFVHSIDVADLEAGVYFVNIKTENGNIVKRFVKK